MASYLDALLADRDRMRRALKAQIEAEAATVRELQAELDRRALELDQKILRLLVFRMLWGPGQQETMAAQVDVEEASKPHTQVQQQLAYHQKVLQALQEALLRVEQTGTLEGAPPAPSGGLSVADIVGG